MIVSFIVLNANSLVKHNAMHMLIAEVVSVKPDLNMSVKYSQR